MPRLDRTIPAAAAAAAARAALAALALCAGCHHFPGGGGAADDDPSRDAGPKRVRCLPVTTRDLRAAILLHGTVSPLPDRDAQIAAQVSGRLTHVLVREGDLVTRGQTLARIDDAALADQATQARAQLAKAQAEAGLARTTRARVDRVFQRGIAARQELDDAEARLTTAQAGESEARASAEIARRQLDRANVRSPLSGVVLKIFRKPGELVDGTAATPILEVGDPSRLELVASATATDLVRLHVGDAAVVDFPALPGGRCRGAVAAVSPAVDRGTGLGSVRVSLNAPAGSRPPVGVTGSATIDIGRPRRATVVPAAALRAALGDEAEVVVCGADRRAHVVRIRRGSTADGLVEVRGAAAGAGAGPADVDADPDASAPGAGLLGAGARVAVDPVLGLGEGDVLEPAR